MTTKCRRALIVSILPAISLSAGLFAQSPVFGQAITISSPLTPTGSALDGVAATLALDPNAMEVLRPARRAMIDNFPLGPNFNVTLDLKRIEPFAPDAKIVAASMRGGRVVEEPIAAPDAVFLGGSVAGVANSQVFLAISSDSQQGWVRVGERMFIVSSGPHGSKPPMPTMVYDLALLQPGAINFDIPPCGTDQLAPIANDDVKPVAGGDGDGDGGIAGSGDGAPCREMRLAIDTDYEFTWNKFAGNPIAAATYAATLVAGCSQIYTTDFNCRLQISFLRLWLTPNDPWTQSGSGNQLGEFRTYWNANQQSTVRDLAHMLSARGLGGGVAWVDVLCNQEYGYAVSGNINGFFPYPLQNNNGQNWDMMVFAHETGHNFSSPHTHNYNPIIDGCGSNPQDCTNANQGTIMSYCHTCSGGMSNIVLDMHPVVEAFVLNDLANESCGFLGSTRPPLAQEDRGYVAEGGAITFDVLANDLETNCDAVTISSFDPFSTHYGTITLSPGTGPGGRDQLVYTAPAGYNGIDTFDYTIIDGASQTSSALVSVRVYGFRTPDARFARSLAPRRATTTSPARRCCRVSRRLCRLSRTPRRTSTSHRPAACSPARASPTTSARRTPRGSTCPPPACTRCIWNRMTARACGWAMKSSSVTTACTAWSSATAWLDCRPAGTRCASSSSKPAAARA